MTYAVDYPLLSAPRIGAGIFLRVLELAASPALPQGEECYRALVAAGVDPAVGLAQFAHESTYGRAGRATANRSWGNLELSTLGLGVRVDGFMRYASWVDGCRDYAALIASGLYGHSAGFSTVRKMPFRYAPAPTNDPAAYGEALVGFMASYLKMEGLSMASGFAAGGLTLTSSHVAELPAGTVLYDHELHRVLELPAAAALDYFGIPFGGGFYLVVTDTAAPYGDGRTRPTLLLAEPAGVAVRPKTPAELAAIAPRYALELASPGDLAAVAAVEALHKALGLAL